MDLEPGISNRTKLTVFLIAFTVRAAYVLAQHQFKLFGGTFIGSDSPLYIEIARNILSGNGIAYGDAPTAYVSPGFPVFLAACLGVFGENLLWTSLFQCILSAAVCVFTARTSALMFGKRAGMIGGLIAAFYYEMVFWTSGQILTEPLYSFFLAAAVCALTAATVSRDAEKSRDLKYAALAGLLFGLAALVRPLALPVALGLGFLLILAGLLGQRRKLKQGLILTAVCLVVMQPWAIRNYLVLGGYVLTSTEGGHVWWLGNNPEYDLYEHPDFTRFGGYTVMFPPPPELRTQLGGKTETEKNSIHLVEAWRHIFAHPTAFSARALHKTWNMWRPTFSGSSLPNRLISYSLYPLILALSVTGIFLALRGVKTEKPAAGKFLLKLAEPPGLLLTFLLIHIFIHAVVNAEIRFRVPLWTALIPFAAATAVKIYDQLKANGQEKPAGSAVETV